MLIFQYNFFDPPLKLFDLDLIFLSPYKSINSLRERKAKNLNFWVEFEKIFSCNFSVFWCFFLAFLHPSPKEYTFGEQIFCPKRAYSIMMPGNNEIGHKQKKWKLNSSFINFGKILWIRFEKKRIVKVEIFSFHLNHSRKEMTLKYFVNNVFCFFFSLL